MKLNNKKGISLIVLVITIIVMIILAAAIILSLQSSGIIGRVNDAKSKSDNANLLEAANIAASEWELEHSLGNISDTAVDYITDKLYDQGFTSEQLDNLEISENGEVSLKPDWDNTQAYLFEIDSSGILTNLSSDYCVYDESSDDNWVYTELDKKTFVEKITVPNKVNDITAIGLADSFFRYNCNVKEVTIPSTIKSLGNKTFEMSSIEIVNLSEGLEIIGSYAFADVYNMKDITIPSTVTSIGEGAFSCCSVETMTILSEDIVLSENVFGYNSTLKEVKVTNETVKTKIENSFESDDTFEATECAVTIIQ